MELIVSTDGGATWTFATVALPNGRLTITLLYHKAVDYALRNGLMGGCSNGLFSPDNNITREQLAVMS